MYKVRQHDQRQLVMHNESTHRIFNSLAVFTPTAPVGPDHRNSFAQAIK
jgi:hypothetical protein